MTSPKLRVLVVSESFLPQINGVTNSVRRVLEHLQTTGHTAELIAPTGPSSYAGARVRTARGATLPFYPDFKVGFETRARLREAITGFGPDVIHLASPATLGFPTARVARELAIPTVAIYQTDLVGFADRYRVLPGGALAAASLTKAIHQLADLTLAPSSASLTQLEGLGIDNCLLWPRGVDAQLFNPARRSRSLRTRLGAPEKVLVGYVGRLAAEKELGLLATLADDPRLQLVLVGSGPEESRLRSLLPQARFLGVLHGEELARAYASLDVFVHTGRHETFCQSAQEALASGVPVVAPDSGGPRDLVASGKTGYLYRPGDGDDMARIVALLATETRYRKKLGRQARISVQDRSWAAVNDALIDHYRTAISGQRVHAPVSCAV
ncbi:glycosyltransferase family 1 protein [soil metagenome]